MKLIKFYLEKRRNYSLPIAIWKIFSKITYGLKVEFESIRYFLFPVRLSDRQFLKAIEPNYNNIKDLLDHIKTRQEPNFFFNSSDKDQMVEVVKHYYNETINQTIEDANKICKHIFNILGSGNIHLRESINWHMDFKTGFDWKLKYHKKIKFGDVNKAIGDIIVPWELSRCQHFITLGKAYWYSKNEKYTKEFVNEINNWIESNPPKFGVNWISTMDVAIRAVNWIWGYYFFKNSSLLNDDFALRFLKSLLIHGRHIEQNLKSSKKRHNHYISRLVGLIYIGVLFPEFKESKKWREIGVRELIVEMNRQILPDGVDYECSTCYHKLVTELFFSATLLCMNNTYLFRNLSLDSQSSVFPSWYMQRLEKMIEFIMYYSNPNGIATQFGDNDDGRLHILSNYGSWNRFDHTYLLSFGALLFKNPVFKKTISKLHEEAFWLFGVDSIKNFIAIPKISDKIHSKSFPNSGIYIMRYRDTHIFIDCISSNSNVLTGHLHNSRLSFEFFTSRKTIIIDPGTYTYTADMSQRNKFRSTAYHNTIMIDGLEQSAFNPFSAFGFKTLANVKVNCWKTTEKYDFLDAEHDGYKSISAIHRRQFFFDKENDIFAIRDHISGSGTHKIEAFFHIDNHIKPYLHHEMPSVILFDLHEAKLALYLLSMDNFEVYIEPSWVSYSYGIKVPSNVIHYITTMQIPFEFTFVIFHLSHHETFHENLEFIKKHITACLEKHS